MKVKVLLITQLIVSICGTIFAFTSVYFDYQRFYLVEGSYTKIKDCVIPNPVTTPCFWGAFGFLAAAIWAFVIYRKAIGEDPLKTRNKSKIPVNKDRPLTVDLDLPEFANSHQSGVSGSQKLKNQQKYFSAFALFGTAFAWANMTKEFIKYFNAGGGQYAGCSGATVTNPFLTPCFGGSVIFLTLFIVSILTYKKLKIVKSN